jgi:hypothetical protein
MTKSFILEDGISIFMVKEESKVLDWIIFLMSIFIEDFFQTAKEKAMAS